ncbi:hypothetical protein WG78_13110 [Amantichitinum ursilacus]|uniref:Uncharacterized protein n=2 Tax=Amantichitinum ursilacus TaxID=857265 RepID=A0A0N0GMU5_9NEIS|nr:hypothetical protein WG78_13110 [Amantichitinum ursilacus]
MILTSFLFGAITVAWWALVWFVLPFDLRRLSIPALITLHVGVPVALNAAVLVFRRWRARAQRVKAALAVQQENQAQQQRIDAARAAHNAQLAERRVSMQCRGAWINALIQSEPLAPLPDADLLEVAERTRGDWAEGVHAALVDLFGKALAQIPGNAWLPVYVLPNPQQDGLAQLELVRKAWQQAAQSAELESAPAQADCKFLPGSGALVDRVLALLANDPGLPGCLVLGVDSLTEMLDQAEDDGDMPDAETLKQRAIRGQPGRAAALLLFTRPGLQASTAEFAPAVATDAYTPYWEQQRSAEAGQLSWGRVPTHLQQGVVAAAPLAQVAAGAQVLNTEAKGNALTRQVQGALEAALINANLRDLPFDAVDAEPPPLAAQRLVHNSGGVAQAGVRLSALALALGYFGCEINVVDEADNLTITFGDTGAAHEPLSLAVAALRVADTGAPAVVAQFDAAQTFNINVLTPAQEPA